MVRMKILLLFVSTAHCLPSPIVLPAEIINSAEIRPGLNSKLCFMPGDYGFSSTHEFFEDCPYESLNRFEIVPMPAPNIKRYGVHAKVCCPESLYSNHICLPSDPWCASYQLPPPPPKEDIDFWANQYGKVGDSDLACSTAGQALTGNPNSTGLELPGVGVLSECVSVSRCPGILDDPFAPYTRTISCGFDNVEKQMMVCCPPEMVTEPDLSTQPGPRFPDPRGEARAVEDRQANLCSRWRDNGGCRLDTHHQISKVDLANGLVYSWHLFELMSSVCIDTCGWTGDKGCVDEHARCPEWAAAGLCNSANGQYSWTDEYAHPIAFMIHTCRESCGVCGFLSPFNNETQVVNGKTYTDYKEDNFECGKYKQLCEINGEDCTKGIDDDIAATEQVGGNNVVEDGSEDDELGLRRETRQAASPEELVEEQEEDDRFFLFSSSDGSEHNCGATIVSDRFLVAAAHCYDTFDGPDGALKITQNTLRDGTLYRESVEMKKVYKHPLYNFPSLYNDVSVIELGRRVVYDYDTYGDSPTCMDQGQYDNVDKVATVQGYGETEDGSRGGLLEANVTVISNDQCKDYLNYNSSDPKVEKKLKIALRDGINYGFLCSQGEMNEEGFFSGSCKGDSGGPLKTKHNDKDTLIGIVSGGIGCGLGIPNWYTKVSYFYPWIDCIIQTSRMTGGVMSEVTKRCDPVAEQLVPPCLEKDELIFSDLDLRDGGINICEK